MFASNFTATGAGVKSLTLTGSSTAANVVAGAIVNSASATAVTKAGVGNWTLSGTNTYTGATTVTTGTLGAGSNAAFGTGTLVLGGGTVVAADAARTLGNAVSLLASSTVGGTNGITFTNTLTNTLAGNPTLTINNSGLTTFGAINLSNSATSRTLTVAGTGDAVVNGVIADGGTATASALTKTGGGTLTLSGSNTYRGATTVNTGTLSVATLANGGVASGM